MRMDKKMGKVGIYTFSYGFRKIQVVDGNVPSPSFRCPDFLFHDGTRKFYQLLYASSVCDVNLLRGSVGSFLSPAASLVQYRAAGDVMMELLHVCDGFARAIH